MNAINSYPSSFAQADTTYNMEDSNSPTYTRQRKRKNDDSNLSEEDKLKKKKNRDAAKKCREKKEKEAKQLKERNNELEKENEQLAKVKIQLEDRITNIKKIISVHMNKGCKLPPHVQEIWDQEFGSTSRMNDMKDFIEVGTMEIQNSRMHTPPHTPDSSSSGRLSPTSSTLFTESSAPTPMPVSLFSGAPIQQQNIRRKNSSASRSPSASPGPTSYTGAPKEDSVSQMQELSQHLFAKQSIHPALAPIQVTPNHPFRISSTVSTDRLSISENYSQVQTVPTVVLDDDSEEGLDYKEDESYILQTTSKLSWTPLLEDPMSKAFEHPDVPSEDVISNELFRSKEFYKSVQIPTENENLSSLGFNAPEGYSFAEDLEEPEPVQNIIEYTTSSVHVTSSVPSVNSNNDRLSKTSTQISSDVSIATCAPALLSLGTDISPTLQAQIKSYSKPNPAVPLVVMHRTQNQQTLLTDHGQQYTIQLVHSNPSHQNNMISTPSKYTSNTSVKELPALLVNQAIQQGQQTTLTVVSPEFVKGLSFQERDQSAVSKDILQHRNIPTCVSNNIMPVINKQQRPQQNISVPQVLLSSSQPVFRLQAPGQNPVATPQVHQSSLARLQAPGQNPVATPQVHQSSLARLQAPGQNPVATPQVHQSSLARLQAPGQNPVATPQVHQASLARLQAPGQNPVATPQVHQSSLARLQAPGQNPVATPQVLQASLARLQTSVQNSVATSQAHQATQSRMQAAVENPTATSQANQATTGRMQASVQNLPSGDFSSAVNDLPSLNFNEMDQENIFEKTRATKVSSS